ncbi:MAG: SsrA-binding protein SmpB [Planctomycetes bacterium]|nr:SsrA-binding protein SmpB [Planctomycetota bacterium]
MTKAKKKPGGGSKPAKRQDLVKNRKARFEYEILDTYEAGLVLRGTEVKSIRAANASLTESFVRFDGEEAYWVGGNVDEYPWGHSTQHDPKRKRKLLLRKTQLQKLRELVRQKGFTIIPLALYLSPRGHIKIEIAVVRGKKTRDKRETEKKREADRELRRDSW